MGVCGICDQLVEFLVIGWWSGNRESTSSTFRFQKDWSLHSCGKHTVNFFHLMGVSVSSKNLQGYASEYYVWPLRSIWSSMAFFNGSTIIMFSCVTGFLSAFSQVSDPLYSLELGKGLEDKSVSIQKRHVKDMVGKWSVVGRPLRILLSCIYAVYYSYVCILRVK